MDFFHHRIHISAHRELYDVEKFLKQIYFILIHLIFQTTFVTYGILHWARERTQIAALSK